MALHAPSTHQAGKHMSDNNRDNKKVNHKIDEIDVTTDTIFSLPEKNYFSGEIGRAHV